ncbi:unnamed protein product, partial [Ixodes hexagonus]
QVTLLYLVSSIVVGDRLLTAGLGQAGFGAPGFPASTPPTDNAYPAQPFSFGYDNVDEYGNRQFHTERADANNVRTGSYGYTDARGLYRRVNYVADANGFRATVETNEPGTQAGASADAVFYAKPVVVAPSAPPRTAAYAAPVYARPAAPNYRHHGYAQAAYGRAGYGRRGYGYRK